MPTQEKIRLSIRVKLFVFVFVAFALMIYATVWLIGHQADAVSAKAIEQSLGQSSVVLETKIESRFNTIEEVAVGIAKDSRILPLVYESASETLQDQSLEFQRVLEFDILFFTDDQGTVLARSDRPDAIGQNLAGRVSFFDQALSGTPAKGYFQSQGRLLQIVVVPVFDNVVPDLVRGSVALAYELSAEMATEINSLTASDIGFFLFTRNREGDYTGTTSTYNTNQALGEALNTYFIEHPEQWQQLEFTSDTAKKLNLTLANDDYFSVIHMLRNEDDRSLGFVMALYSSTELLKPYKELQQSVVVVGILCLFSASVFAWIFSMRISRPIVELVGITRNIQEGQFPSKSSSSGSSDEVGLLYRAVLKMGKNLQEKAELENYLAQMSNDIDLNDAEPIVFQEDGTLINSPDNTLLLSATLPSHKDSPSLADNDLINDTQPSSNNSQTFSGLATGSVILERYELLKPLGQGAMGIVFHALDKGLNEKVAIKFLPKTLFLQHDNISFKEEIRLARRITHRNILRTYDFGEWQDYIYITMEYVAGYDLDQLIKGRGALSEHMGVLMARQICSAINAAHEQGVIHLDLKPSNMMINRQGILKIMDFGLARQMTSSTESADASTATQENKKNVVVGTPKYMAPEQFLHQTLDERTDIYAIGIILFTLLTGKPPFEGNDFLALAEGHLHQDLPDINGPNGSVSEKLTAIILRAVQKAPSDRYQSITELLDDVNKVEAAV